MDWENRSAPWNIKSPEKRIDFDEYISIDIPNAQEAFEEG